MAGPGYHRSIVCAQDCGWIVESEIQSIAFFLQATSQQAVACDTAGQGQLIELPILQSDDTLCNEYFYGGNLETRGNVRLVPLQLFRGKRLYMVQYRRLQSTITEIE